MLSTYAGLGSLANVFRETGALDLILELLWTNDVETRRAAGRMLRALALHDAGTCVFVGWAVQLICYAATLSQWK